MLRCDFAELSTGRRRGGGEFSSISDQIVSSPLLWWWFQLLTTGSLYASSMEINFLFEETTTTFVIHTVPGLRPMLWSGGGGRVNTGLLTLWYPPTTTTCTTISGIKIMYASSELTLCGIACFADFLINNAFSAIMRHKSSGKGLILTVTAH
jgi:hypothetical protein